MTVALEEWIAHPIHTKRKYRLLTYLVTHFLYIYYITTRIEQGKRNSPRQGKLKDIAYKIPDHRPGK